MGAAAHNISAHVMMQSIVLLKWVGANTEESHRKTEGSGDLVAERGILRLTSL